MTRMRSDSERISSSSSETSNTARPASRCSTSWRCTNSIAPTSRPRVGCAAISTFGSASISRASTTFCWLPPDSDAAGVSGVPPRTSNSCSSRTARSPIVPELQQAAARVRRLAVRVQREVLREREWQHETAPVPVLRDVPDSLVEDLARVRVRDVDAVDDDAPGRAPAAARRSRRSARLPVRRRRRRSRESRPPRTSRLTSAHRLEARGRRSRARPRPAAAARPAAPASCRRAAAPRGRPSSAPGSLRSRRRRGSCRPRRRVAAP